MLRLKLFGPGEAFYQDQPLTGFPNQQHYLLFCYLLLNREGIHSREQLAAVFWGDYPDRTARKYLRNSLWRLRQALESAGVPVDDYLQSSEDAVRFIDSGPYWLDIEQFRTTLTHYQDIPGETLTTAQAVELEQTLALYTGDLLAGLDADWCLFEREQLRLLYLNALSKLMVFHETRRQYEQSLAYGKRILALDDIREATHRQMMRLYWLAGRRSEALAQYHRCIRILQEELNVPPVEETRQLYWQILSDRSPGKNQKKQRAALHSIPPEESSRRLAQEALRRLKQVRSKVEAVQIELQSIEALLTDFCSDDAQDVRP